LKSKTDRELAVPTRVLSIKRISTVSRLARVRRFFPYTVEVSRYDRPSHRVYMTFFRRQGWYVQFLEADCENPLPRTRTFSGPEKIQELARRGEAWGDSESRQALEHAIENGRAAAT
jgi:hypothetical protein